MRHKESIRQGRVEVVVVEMVVEVVHATTVEPVYIEQSREMKKCSMYAGVQCIQSFSELGLDAMCRQ